MFGDYFEGYDNQDAQEVIDQQTITSFFSATEADVLDRIANTEPLDLGDEWSI